MWCWPFSNDSNFHDIVGGKDCDGLTFIFKVIVMLVLSESNIGERDCGYVGHNCDDSVW
jgi:hypothetical protein